MSIVVMANNGIPNIRAEMDGALFDVLAARTDFIFRGIGDSFQHTVSASSLSVNIGTGLALIGGRLFKIDEPQTVTLTANASNVIVLRIDLTAGDGNEGSVQVLSSVSQMVTEDLNAGGNVRDMALIVANTNGSGVTSVTSMRNGIYTTPSKSVIQVEVDEDDPMPITLSTSNVTVCPLNKKTFNIGYEMALTADGGIMVTKSGYYRVTGSVYLRVASTSRVGCYISKNGTTDEITSQWIGSDPNSSQYGNVSSGEKIAFLNAGDVVYLSARAKIDGATGTVGHRWLIVERMAYSG